MRPTLPACVGERISKIVTIDAFDRKFQVAAPEHRDGGFFLKRLSSERWQQLVVIGAVDG